MSRHAADFGSKKKPQPQTTDSFEIATDLERRSTFLRYLNLGWLLVGIVTLATIPFFPQQRSVFGFLILVIFPSYLVTRFLLSSGRARLAGVFFTLIVDICFYSLFILLARQLGAEKAFDTQISVWMLMGLAVIFAGTFVDKWAAPVVALINTILLIGTQLILAPNTAPRPSAMVFWWMLALIVWLYERALTQAFKRMFDDLSERRRAEAEVRRLNSQLEKTVGEGEKRFRRVFEVSPVAIVITTLDEGRTIDANDAYWRLSGHNPQTSIGKTTTELRAGYDAGKRQEFIDTLVEKKSIKNPNYVFKDDAGRDHFTLAFFELIELDGQPAILSMFSDLTEQVEAENALRGSEMRERGLLNAVPDAIFELRHDGMVLQFIPSEELSSLASFEDLLGKSIHQIMPAPIATQIMFAVERALESGQLHIIEYQLVQDGIEKTYEARVAVSGEDTTLMIVRDISLHKWLETERENLINELDAKSSELERFTYAVSHDLKSPLITVQGFLGFLKQDIVSGNIPRAQADIQRMSAAMETMQHRLDDVLELSHVGRLENKPEEIRFNDLVAEVLELVHGRISQGGISVHVEENLPTIYGDHQRLLEVIQNLVDNAAKFMGAQKNPLIEIGQHGEDHNGKPIFFVKDNGMGIPPEQHEKIFGIFNKLDSKAEGTGIGLSLVKKIIEAQGGRIWIESEVGQGSTFCFTLGKQ